MENRKINTIDALQLSGSTGNISVAVSKDIASLAQKSVKGGHLVAISMQGISAMSLDASTLLCSQLMSDQELARKTLIVGATPYINQIIRAGIRNAKRK